MKKVLSVVMAVMLMLSIVPVTSFAAETAVPEGYTGVYTIEDLYCIRYALDKNYILMDDIDLTEATAEGGDWDNGCGWTPIGEDYGTRFTGLFDGNSHTINGLQIRGKKTGYAGLFGYVDGSIKNLIMTDVNIEVENTCVGSIAGFLNGTIENVKTNGTIIAEQNFAGGVIGYLRSGTIKRCANYVNVSGANSAGGIVASSDRPCEIIECYNCGKVSSNNNAGGILGISDPNTYYNYTTKVINCYNAGNISSNNQGGIVGRDAGDESLLIANCVNIGNIEGESDLKGAIIGTNYRSHHVKIEKCYYKQGTAPSGKQDTNDTATTAVALTAAQMKLKSVYGYLDFENVWFMNSGMDYPQLISNPETAYEHTHDYAAVVTAPTCTAQGYTTYTCSCGDSYVADYVPATGHKEGEWKITNLATTTETGIKTLYCSECGAAIRTEVIPKIDPSKGKVKSVSINDISLNYKGSAKINPSINADSGVKYKVEYKSSNTGVATVDNNGNVYGTREWTASSATITCTVTDEFGNVVSDTANVTVGFAWWQWIIGIVLFGWIWY